MPRNPKMFLHGGFYELCFRTEQGLPMICAGFMQRILLGYLAAAQTKYPLIITDVMFMGNHLHLGIVVIDPANVPRFCEYFKRESGHAINRLQGRVGITVWQDGYDSPIIVDAEKAVERLVYWYTNPAQAGLVKSIEGYPNFSSWVAFCCGAARITTSHKRIPRDEIPQILEGELGQEELNLLDNLMAKKGCETFQLTIEPLAWLKCFDASKGTNRSTIRQQIIARVQEREAKIACQRGTPAIGAERLKGQSIYQSHLPEKRGKRMICLGSTKTLRLRFIRFFKEQAKKAKHAIQKARLGVPVSLPPSFFYPGGYLLSNLSPPFSPLPLA